MVETPRKLEIPRPPTPKRLKHEITFEQLQQEISPYINEKLANFSAFIREHSVGIERAKKLYINEPDMQLGQYSYGNPSIEEITRMEERDKEISNQLERIRALTFALETEQSSIRQQLYK